MTRHLIARGEQDCIKCGFQSELQGYSGDAIIDKGPGVIGEGGCTPHHCETGKESPKPISAELE